MSDPYESESIAEWLAEDDSKSRPYRVERLRFLRDEYGDATGYRVFHGGVISAQAFEEARLAYLHGLFLGCIVLAQVCLEHELQGLLYGAGRNDLHEVSYAQLLQVARDERLLSGSEFELFDRLRQLRNPYVHFRPPGDPESHVAHAVGTRATPDDVLVEDARLAIRALLHLCSRPPFATSVTE